MSCYVYVIGTLERCAKSTKRVCRTYVGWTNDIDARLAAHNAGVGARATRGRKWKLLYAESYQSKSEAMSREWHLKRNRKLRRDIASVMTQGE